MGRGDSVLAGRVVFLTGCRRSGTNWLQRILTAHPDVVGMPSETYLFNGGFSKLADLFQHANPGSPKTGKVFMTRNGMFEAIRDFADRVFDENLERLGRDARYLVERTPWHVYDLELIGGVYPDARVIHIIRDGRDVARSLLSQGWGPTRMEEAAEEWRSSVTAGRFRGRSLGNRYLEVRYEDLLESPGPSILRIYGWLGLDIDCELMKRVFEEAASEFNVDPKSPGVARGKWRSALSASDLATFDRVAGKLLTELGYEPTEVPTPTSQGLDKLRRGIALGRRLVNCMRPRSAQRSGQDRDTGYAVFETFLEHVGAGRLDAALAMLGPQAHVRVGANGFSKEARGEAARELLREHLACVSDMEVRSGNVHPGIQTSTSVTTYALPDGRVVARTLTLSAAAAKVRSVSLFDFELARKPGPLVAQP